MRVMLFLPLILAAGAAQAHPGHLTDVAGHDHWVAGAAIGLAIALGLWGALRGKGAGKGRDGETASDAEPETHEGEAEA